MGTGFDTKECRDLLEKSPADGGPLCLKACDCIDELRLRITDLEDVRKAADTFMMTYIHDYGGNWEEDCITEYAVAMTAMFEALKQYILKENVKPLSEI